MIEAVVLANGDYPTHQIPVTLLNDAPYVVCCDGGADGYIAHGHVPDAIVGDGDSLSEDARQNYAHLLHRITEQETNDLTKAVNFLMSQGKRHIAIVGATGKREDHTLGNISHLIDYQRLGLTVRIFTDYGCFMAARGTQTFSCKPGQQVSIFNFTAHGMHSQGLVYPIRDFDNWWQGTLNECTGTKFTIAAEGEYLLFLEY